MAAPPTDNLDIKREQFLDLQLQEAYKRGNAIKAYEVITAPQLPVPVELTDLIRSNTQPKNLIHQLAHRELSGQSAVENFIASFNPDFTNKLTPAPILAKTLDVSNCEKQELVNRTGQMKLDPTSWIVTSRRYNKLKSELTSPKPPGSTTN